MPSLKELREEAMMRTARAAGAVGHKAIVPRVVRTFALPQHKILDYGAGEHAMHTMALRDAGFNVTAHDLSVKKPEVAARGILDPNALKRRYDLVFASNVLNVQPTRRHISRMLNEIASTVHPQGMAIINFPHPRKEAFAGMDGPTAVKAMEVALKRRFHHVERHPMGTNQEPVWILKNPKHYVKPQGE